jgi:hypothetical protein
MGKQPARLAPGQALFDPWRCGVEHTSSLPLFHSLFLAVSLSHTLSLFRSLSLTAFLSLSDFLSVCRYRVERTLLTPCEDTVPSSRANALGYSHRQNMAARRIQVRAPGSAPLDGRLHDGLMAI